MSDRTKKKAAAPMMEVLRSLITEARIICHSPNSVPAVTHEMLNKIFLKKIAHVRGLRMHLLAGGLSDEIRRFLKNDPDQGDEVTVDQLDLWPAHLRPMIKEIGRARIFVPSRGEFVMLDPKVISADETKEAGEYLIAKGQDCIRVGNSLKALARRM